MRTRNLLILIILFTIVTIVSFELRFPPYLLFSEPIPFESLLSTYQGFFEDYDTFAVIQNQSRWERVWRRLSLSQTPAGMEPIPVDFSNTTLIGAFGRTYPTGGYDTRVVYVGRLDDRVHVTVFKSYVGGNVIQVLTSPTHIVKIAKTSLPVEFHVFDEGSRLWTKVVIITVGSLASIYVVLKSRRHS